MFASLNANIPWRAIIVSIPSVLSETHLRLFPSRAAQRAFTEFSGRFFDLRKNINSSVSRAAAILLLNSRGGFKNGIYFDTFSIAVTRSDIETVSFITVYDLFGASSTLPLRRKIPFEFLMPLTVKVPETSHLV